MKKSTALVVLSVILLSAALAVGVNSVRVSRSYLDCASRLMSEAPPGDRVPPESFHRLSRALRGKTDLYLSRVLAQECTKELDTAPRGFGRRLIALGTLKAQLPLEQRENLDAVLLPARGGRGLTHSARTEWGRPPETLTDAEMTWLFVVGQIPNCSRSGTVPERDRRACDYNYKLLLSKLRSLDSAAPAR